MPDPIDPQLAARLAMQGFGELDDPDWVAVVPWLRVAPGACALWAAVATITAIDTTRRRVTLKTQCLNGDKVVIDGEAVVLVPRRDAA